MDNGTEREETVREDRTEELATQSAAEPEAEGNAPGGSAAEAPGAADTQAALREELNRVQERVTQLERERILLSQGVAEDDLDYYVFKIGKLMRADGDFAEAAKDYLKEHGTPQRGQPQRSTGASLSGRAARPQSTNDTMNRLLRGR